eukprot:scaffold12872_cov23-Tisochrysis_lutea.AAC.2
MKVRMPFNEGGEGGTTFQGLWEVHLWQVFELVTLVMKVRMPPCCHVSTKSIRLGQGYRQRWKESGTGAVVEDGWSSACGSSVAPAENQHGSS